MGESPFRERPRVLLCPRCGDVLEQISDGVHTCTRCEGAWLPVATIDRAFGTPRWPGGASAWWRRALECPACAFEGGPGAMTPTLLGDLILDRCATHGVWLDHGELGRLLGAPNVVELEALYEKINPGREPPARLLAQRKRREAEIERRQREIDEYRTKLAADAARLAAEKRAAEAERVEQLRAAERERLRGLKRSAETQVEAAEKVVVELRANLRGAESELADVRSRLLEIDRQLEQLDRG